MTTPQQSVQEQTTAVAVEKAQVVGSKEYLVKKLIAFSEGIGPHKITNPFDQARFVREEIFTPAFNMESL